MTYEQSPYPNRMSRKIKINKYFCAAVATINFICDSGKGAGFPVFSHFAFDYEIAANQVVYNWSTIYACPTNEPLPPALSRPLTPTCVYRTSDNAFYDFSSLAGDVQVSDGGSNTFVLNLCQPISYSSPTGTCTSGSTFVCSTSSSGAFPTAIAKAAPNAKSSVTLVGGQGVTLTFGGGAVCGSSQLQAQINMICTQGTIVTPPVYSGYSNCVHSFTWNTNLACSVPAWTPETSPITWNGWGPMVYHKCSGNTFDIFVTICV